ncbi:hypothetical protein EUGRSUZ_C02789 [Eucalyptus grandis]|uniref:Uncharacterized protein n=2 Tax=Eucalyptus grandis TaxID=71139 RepID=A0A059CSR0_EUCGR|nr:hypothetical protein EUGRSUZ_C02789 [Eucalyptus grandis]
MGDRSRIALVVYWAVMMRCRAHACGFRISSFFSFFFSGDLLVCRLCCQSLEVQVSFVTESCTNDPRSLIILWS